MALDELAQKLFGAKRAESNSVLVDSHTDTLVGTAVGDSADGSVMVELSSDVTNPEPLTIDGEVYYEDADTAVELPTTASVKAGDDVLVTVYGGTSLRSPVVTGVVGSGDRIAADVEAAREIAEATGQHFWDADDGAHVTELAREEWEAQQTGPNSLWNSLGMLFRDGLNNLLAIVTGQNPGLQIYDGQGNTDENILAEFTADRIRLGGELTSSGAPTEAAVEFFDAEGMANRIDASYGISSSGQNVYTSLALGSEINDTALGYSGEVGGHGSLSFSQAAKNNGSSAEGRSYVTLNASAYSEDVAARSASIEINVEATDFGGSSINMTAETLGIIGGVKSGYFSMEQVIKAFEDVTGQITLSGADNGSNVKEAHRRGYTCSTSVLYFRLTSALASGSNVVIGTVPSGYRPSATMFTAPFCNDATFGGRVFVGIEAGGAIRLYNHSGSQLPTTVRMSATWTYVVA